MKGMNNKYLSVDSCDGSTYQQRSLDNGEIEEIHTMPKQEYYASLRVGSNSSIARNPSRANSHTTLSKRSSSILSFRSSTDVYKPCGKNISCNVEMLDGEEKTFEVDAASLGQQLFDRVIESLNLTERDFFGLKYNDKLLKTWFWLSLEKKIAEQMNKNPLVFEFQVKFYTPHINNIQEDLTRYMFCLQVRQNIISGIIPASFHVLALLGAYAVQSEAGDYNSSVHKGIDYIKAMPFAPNVQQTDELLSSIADLHKQIGQISPEEADRNFMWNATKLGMYGVDMHKVKNNEDEEVFVGVYHSGVLIYRNKIRVIRFSWPKILKLTYKTKSFFVMLRATEIEKKERNLEFKCGSHILAKRLWRRCVEQHSFFRMLDAENPGKPRLNPGFGTRKYRFRSEINSRPQSDPLPAMMSPKIVISRPEAKVKRLGTLRRDIESSSFSPTGMAPVADADEVFSLDDDIHVVRPKLPFDNWKMTQNDCTLDMGLDPSGLYVEALEGSGWQGTRSNKGVQGSGKYYYEGTVIEDGLIRLGWSTNDASLDLGSDKYGFGYGADQDGTVSDNGFKRNDCEETPYGEPIKEGDRIGCSIDLDNGCIQWSKNGIQFNIAYQIPDDLRTEAFFPACSVNNGIVLFNFGDLPMEYRPDVDCSTLSDAPGENVVLNKFGGWRMNPYDATKGTEVSENGLIIQSNYNDGWHGCRANKGLFDAGKYYYEVTPIEDGLARVGWATDEGNLNLGSDRNGFGYGADDDGFGLNRNQGKKMNEGDINNYGNAFGKLDVIGCFLDLDNGKIKWSKNGQVFQEAYGIPDDLLELRAFYPTASILNNTLDFNFGNKPFSYYPGNEWTPVCYAAYGNTESSKKQNPNLLIRPNIDRQEDILEIRRQNKEKFKVDSENAIKIKQLEEENRRRIINETERIEIQEKERRRLLQRQREEKERELTEIERRNQEQRERDEEERIRLNTEKEVERKRKLQQTDIEEHTETIIRGKPEVSTETFIDEQGRTVTKTLRKTKVTKCTSVNRNTVDRTEDEFSINQLHRMKAVADDDEDEDDLLNAIFEVTQLSPLIRVKEGVHRMSISYDHF